VSLIASSSVRINRTAIDVPLNIYDYWLSHLAGAFITEGRLLFIEYLIFSVFVTLEKKYSYQNIILIEIVLLFVASVTQV